jgi:protein-S-isoprenylcysteine O-methyltransferase Ste14
VSEPLVFQHGAPATAFRVTIGVWVAFEFVMSLRQASRLRHLPRHDPTGLLLVVCMAGSLYAAVSLGRDGPLPWPGGRLWPVVAGLVLVAPGIGLRTWSIATLGRFFQYRIEVQPDHHVVTGGPYRYVRHPSYSGLALILLGLALATGDVLSLLPVAVLGAAGLAVRIHAEERALREALGPQYERFAASRKRLMPRIW